MNDTPSHWDAATQRYFFKKVPGAEVAEVQIARAADVRAFVCPDLKIEPPTIVWLSQAPPSSKRGPLKFDHEEELDSVVRLRIDLSAGSGYGLTPKSISLYEIWIPRNLTAHPDLEYVVAHELRHAAQKKLCSSVYYDEVQAEGDAYPYGYHILRRYLESRNELTEALRLAIDSHETGTKDWFQKQYPNRQYAMMSLISRPPVKA